ncbi:unnamed protein product [Schistocephalus solidus]|uniref:Syntaxin-12 n=1 Tax=Schistocephalus solidus TaxID=70667 RepID=A0A0X3Q6K4_SCHSO|nr:unnamed protein product [Schistocephalus solidus]
MNKMALTGVASNEMNTIEQSIQRIKHDLDQFEEILKRAESGHATVSFLNEKYHAIILSTKDLSQHLRSLRSASHSLGESSETRVRARQLHEQAMAQTTRIQRFGREVQRVSESLAHAAAMQGDRSAVGGGSADLMGFEGGPAQQQQVVLQIESEEQRAREMEALESDIVLVNELFTTLATYVHDQGELVDSIEANTEAAYVQVASGVQQLNSAVVHRKSARRRKCICALIFIVLIVIIGLIIGLSLRSNS